MGMGVAVPPQRGGPTGKWGSALLLPVCHGPAMRHAGCQWRPRRLRLARRGPDGGSGGARLTLGSRRGGPRVPSSDSGLRHSSAGPRETPRPPASAAEDPGPVGHVPRVSQSRPAPGLLCTCPARTNPDWQRGDRDWPSWRRGSFRPIPGARRRAVEEAPHPPGKSSQAGEGTNKTLAVQPQGF